MTKRLLASATLFTSLMMLPFGMRAMAQEALQVAQLGDIRLGSGATLRQCRLGYRTFGILNADRSNAVLFPTWLTGTSKDLIPLIGPNGIIDSHRYYVIAVDSLGDGISSSPSNSPSQPRTLFPKFTIRDMVNTQYALLTRTLHIKHLKAVMGVSMGGMQALQWASSYPAYIDGAISIVGTPQASATDLLLYHAEMNAIRNDKEWQGGLYRHQPKLAALLDIQTMALTTPGYRDTHTSREQFPAFLASTEQVGPARFDANNWLYQLQAMVTQDITVSAGGSLKMAAAQMRVPLLFIVSRQDHLINPSLPIRFAQLTGSPVVELTSDCGHLAVGCETDKIIPAVRSFLEVEKPNKQ